MIHLDSAINQKVTKWKKACPEGNIAAKVKYNLYEVKSKHKLGVDLGFDLTTANQHFDVDFEAVEKGESRKWILKYGRFTIM